MFEVQPSEKTNRRVRFYWELYTGQHWRKPVIIIADDTIRIAPESQTTISVRHIDNQWQGIEPKSGLVIPVRGKEVLDQNFAVAYMFGEDMREVVLMNKKPTCH